MIRRGDERSRGAAVRADSVESAFERPRVRCRSAHALWRGRRRDFGHSGGNGGPGPPQGPWQRSSRLLLVALGAVVVVALLFLAFSPSINEGGRHATGEASLAVHARDLKPKTDRSCATAILLTKQELRYNTRRRRQRMITQNKSHGDETYMKNGAAKRF